MTKQKKVRPPPYEWLDRYFMPPLPFLTLVLSPAELDAATAGLDKNARSEFPASGASTFTFDKGAADICCIVALASEHEKRDRIQIYALLVHEAVHVWQKYRAGIGEHTPGKEQEAYAVQAISQNLMYEYERRMKKAAKTKKGN